MGDDRRGRDDDRPDRPDRQDRSDDETRHYSEGGRPDGSLPDDVRPASIPDTIGPFRILGLLGEGGMGVVYEAEQAHPNRRVALKVIRSGAFATERQVAMFQREADLLARLKHPGIAAIHHFDETGDGRPYFVMELIRGRPLDAWLADQPPLTDRAGLRTRLGLFRQICDAVHYAHQRGVIHRDLKPSNVLVVEDDPDVDASSSGSAVRGPQTKILDFGLARITDVEATQMTEVGVIKGTLQYMSPEQTSGRPEDVDTRADVYALGALLYELLSGRRPYDLKREAIAEAIRIICEKEPEPLSSTWSGVFRPDPDIETIVAKALEKQPDRRYSSVAAFSDDVERYLTSQPILARPPSAAYQLRKMVGRHRVPFAVGVGALSLIVVSAVVSTALWIRAERAAERERIETAKAEEVADFMTDMLEAVGPSVALGRDTTMLREILDSTVERIDAELGNSPEVAHELQSHIAKAYFELSELSSAIELYRAAREKALAVYGPDHPETLMETRNLAMVLAASDAKDESEALFREALEARRRLTPDDEETALTMLYLGNLLNDTEREAEAEPYLLEAIERLRALEPEGGENLAIALNSLGNLYHGLMRLDEAEPLYREALAMHTELLGDIHPVTLVDRHNLAYLLANKGDPQAAERQFLEVLETQRRILGEDHRNVATTHGSIGKLLQNVGDFRGAAGRFREAIAILERIDGTETAEYAAALANLAYPLKVIEERDEAEALYRRALAIQLRVLGEDSLSVATTRGELGALLISADRLVEAAEQSTEALRIQRLARGEDHPQVLILQHDLGLLQSRMGNLDEAETILQGVLDARVRTMGPIEGVVARSQYDLGLLKIKIGTDESVTEGERLLREAAETYLAAMGEQHPGVAMARFRLGMHLVKTGAYAEAEPLMLAGREGFVVAYGADHGNVRRAAEELATLYDGWGRPDRAAEWRAAAAP